MAEQGMEQVSVVEPEVIRALTKAELDQSIATAKQYPRSIQRFQREVESMACLNERVASECIYTLPPREDGQGRKKSITGPSIRMAEVVLSAWGNCRVAARVLDDSGDFVRAQGVFMDLERNVAVSYEVTRRIVDKYGRRYSPDMVMVTANAACSVALRDATLRGIPKGFWSDAFDKVQAVVRGDLSTLESRRNAALEWLGEQGVSAERAFAALEVAGIEDIGLDELLTLRGLVQAVKDGVRKVSEAFPDAAKVGMPTVTATTGVAGLKAKLTVPGAETRASEPPAQAGASAAEHAPKEGSPEPLDPNAPRPLCAVPGCVRERRVDSDRCDEHFPMRRKKA